MANAKPEVNGADDSPNGAVELAELQKGLAKMAADKTLPGSAATLFTQLKEYLTAVDAKLSTLVSAFDTLTTQLTANCDAQNKQIGEVYQQVRLISERFGIRIRGPKPAPVAPEKAKGVETPAPGTPLAELTKKYPEKCFISGLKHVLSPGYEFDLKVGDLHFWSMEQALYYITFQHMERPELAAKVKRTAVGGPNSARLLGIAVSQTTCPEMYKSEDAWLEAMKDIAASLFLLRLKQCKDFEEKNQEEELANFKEFVFVSNHPVIGTGCNLHELVKAPESYKGKNLYGVWLKEFIEAHRLGFPGGEPLDVKKYCTYEAVPLSEDKEKVLVVGDVQLNGFMVSPGTKLIVKNSMGCVEHPKDESSTAKKVIENEDLEPYSAVVLLFGTFEVGKSPDKIESDYMDLLKFIRSKAPDVAIFVGNALPRVDKFAEQVKLTNYAIGIATRNMDDPRVVLLDINAKLPATEDLKKMMKPNGYALDVKGAEKLADILVDQVPFVGIQPPVPPAPPRVRKSFGKDGPPSKRGRYNSGFGGSRDNRSSFGSFSRGGAYGNQGSTAYNQSGPVVYEGTYSPWGMGNTPATAPNAYSNTARPGYFGMGQKYDY